MAKRNLSPEVREYFQEIGRKRGNQLKEKYGSDYFRQIAAKRKTFGRKPSKNSVVDLSNRFNLSRQRIYDILKGHGTKFNKETYTDIGAWREAVVTDFVKKTAEKTIDKEQA